MTDIQVSKMQQNIPFSGMPVGPKMKINIQILTLFILVYRPKKLSKSKLESSKTPRSPSPKREPLDLDTIKRLVLVSKNPPFYIDVNYRLQNPTSCHRGSLR